MKTELKKDGDCRLKLIINAEAAETKSKYEEVVAQFIREVKLPGFRPGKAPRNVIESKYRGEINQTVRERLVDVFLPQAAKENNLKLVSVVNVSDDIFSPETGVNFVATVDVAPEFKLPKYTSLGVKRNGTEVTDAQVDERIRMYCKHLGAFEDAVAGYALTEDDLASIDYTASAKGVAAEELGEDKSLVEGKDFWMQMAYGELVPGMAKEMIGMKVGETREFSVALTKDFHVESLQGKKLKYEVKVNAIRARKPAPVSELLSRFQAESEEALKKTIRESMEEQAKQTEDNRVRSEIFDALAKKADFALPQSELNQSVQHELQEMMNSYRNVPKEELEKNRDEIVKNVKESAERRLRLRYILLGIADAEKAEASKAEITAELTRLADEMKMPYDKLLSRVYGSGSLGVIVDDIRVEKTVKKLVETVA